MRKCKSCGAWIIWIKLPGGKAMPCDPDQVLYRRKKGAKGRIVTANGEVYYDAALNVEPNEAEGIGYISHFATCPFADENRGKGKQTATWTKEDTGHV